MLEPIGSGASGPASIWRSPAASPIRRTEPGLTKLTARRMSTPCLRRSKEERIRAGSKPAAQTPVAGCGPIQRLLLDVTYMCPPCSRTAAAALTAAAGDLVLSSRSAARTWVNAPLRNGRASASAQTRLADTPASSSLFRAITSQRKAMSTPVRSWNTSAAATREPPLPQPRSRSVSPGPAERSASTAGRARSGAFTRYPAKLPRAFRARHR